MKARLALLFLASGSLIYGQSEPIQYARDIQPVLQKYCVKCHGADEQNSGLRLDQKQRAYTGGDSGSPAITPHELDQSQIIRRITSTHKEEQMPPKGPRLPPEVIDVLKRWIQAGAEWPNEKVIAAESIPGANHWSFQPLSQPLLPKVKDTTWAQNPIDQFIQAKREQAGLPPQPDSSASAFIRRASYDLTGMPPSADEVQDFTRQSFDQKAVDQLISRLLNSPRYGERWGRHWMDWVRYADTAGDNSDYPIPQAYLYRNYIIQSLNEDVPYDRFLTEQLAGDLLPAASQDQRNRQVIATGYLAMSRRFGSLLERYPQHLTIEDTLDNLGRTTMGLTLSCARCHDHKFDPISTRDYYGLYGIFASTRYPLAGLEFFQTQHDFVPLISAEEAATKLAAFKPESDRLADEMNKQLAACSVRTLENARIERSLPLAEQRRNKRELDGMLSQARKAGEKLAKHLKTMPFIPTAYAVQEGTPTQARIQLKGEPERPGASVPRKFLDILGGQLLPEEAQKGSGRLQLAQWLTQPDNPLTARVMVNRIWQRHFGKGLVASTSDFGLRGDVPTHPELLDWLAGEFIRSGWSFKHMHRLIMSSRTYRLSSQDSETSLAHDPNNHLYWKFNRQRLDAESLRDTLLLLSGNLDPRPQTKPYPIPPQTQWKYTQHHPFKDDYPSNKRSVYLMTKRLTTKPYFQTFDGADANVCTTARDSSVTALQALYFVNDAFVHRQANDYAKSLLDGSAGDAEKLNSTFLSLLAREVSEEELPLLKAHLQELRSKTANEQEVWASLSRSLFRLNEFLYLD